jgi:hypothetical protein
VAEILVRQTNAFLRAYKKLKRNQMDAVDQAVEDIVSDPAIGEEKKAVYQVFRFTNLTV